MRRRGTPGPRPSPRPERRSAHRVAGCGDGAPCGWPAPGRRVAAAPTSGPVGRRTVRLGLRSRGGPAGCRSAPARACPTATGCGRFAAQSARRLGVKGRAEFRSPAQIPGRRENAEAARTPGQVVVDPVRRLARVTDDIEDVSGGKIEDRQPVEDFAPGHAHAVVAAPGDPPGARSALVAPDARQFTSRPPKRGCVFRKCRSSRSMGSRL